MTEKKSVEKTVREIRRKTRKKYSAEEKIRIVLEGLRGEGTIAELCRREGIPPNMYYKWSKEFLEAGKQRLQGDTKRHADGQEVQSMKRENECMSSEKMGQKGIIAKRHFLELYTHWCLQVLQAPFS